MLAGGLERIEVGMNTSLVAYRFKCRKRGCQNFVEKRDDLCDSCLLDKYGLNSYQANELEEDQNYIEEEPVILVLRKFERKLRKR